MSLSVVLADDNLLIRTGLRTLIDAESDLEVVGEAGDGAAAVDLAETLAPDVVLMDIRMSGMGGIAATRRILDTGAAGIRVLVLTTFDVDEYVFAALHAGASGFVLKDDAGSIPAAIRTVAAGDAVLAPSVTRMVISELINRTAASPAAATTPVVATPAVTTPPSLTRRELEVLRLLALGLSNAELSAHLAVGENTVKSHVASLLKKLGVRDRLQAVIYAYRSGLADTPASPHAHPGAAIIG